MNRAMLRVSVLLFCCCTFHVNLFSQEKTKVFPVGILFKPGITTGTINSNSQIQNSVEDYHYFSSGYGLFGIIPVYTDKPSRSIGVFARIELGFDKRVGGFENNGTIAKISASYLDLNLLGHVVADFGLSVRGYMSIGLNLGYEYKKEIVPNIAANLFIDRSRIVPAGNIEFGFMIGSSSLIGIRSLIESSGEIRYKSASLVLGFSPQFLIKK